MRIRHHNRRTVRLLPLLLGAVFSNAVLAADETLEEVVVTAQKRTERLQDVPLSVTAISGSQLENRGILGAANLNALAPNVSVKAAQPGSSLTAAVTIRGVGSGQPGIWSDGAVALYLDGIYIGKTQGGLLDMLDLERVEVLRGPQGTLFGKNTEGGAINFITRRPAGEFGGKVGIDVGNHGQQVLQASLDLPRMGMVRLGISARDEQRDGTVANPSDPGRPWNNRNRQAQRLTAGVDISPAFKVDYAYDHTHINETPTALSLLNPSGYAALYPTTYAGTLDPIFGMRLRPAMAPYAQSGYPTAVSSNPGRHYGTRLDVNGQSLTASYALASGDTFKYLLAQRRMRYQEMLDLDGTPVDVLNASKDTVYATTSHELQWIGQRERLNWVAGLYLFRDDGNTFSDQSGQYFTFGFAPAKERWFGYRTRSNARAVYGQLDYKLTSALTGTLGLRRSWEEKKGDVWSTWGPLGQPALEQYRDFAAQGARASFAATTPTVALSYQARPGLTVYGRLARGFKSGGFPLEADYAALALRPFHQETSTSFELGVKSAFNDGKAQLNAALFSTEVRDFHINQLPPGGIAPVTVNAGKMQSEGLEIEGLYQLVDGWRLQASYGYLHMKFKEYDTYNPSGARVNVADNTVASYSPRHQLTLSLDGRLARTAWGTWRAIVDYSFASSYYNYQGQITSVGNNVAVGNTTAESRMPALGLVHARLLLSGIPVGGPGKAELSLWARNLTNVQKQATHIDVAGLYRIAGWTDPRMVGLGLSYRW
ncbi:MAG: TonB-dependent receptor [Sterolibacterium sp.]|nr:TonB-dependent receptor [Sterolibacterium sp.]MBP9799215.1 TonB-dependent receptor [Sterolibacterium sp.]